MLTTRQALTGPWAGNLAGWGSTAVPGSLIVVMQELPVGYPSGWYVVASIVLQFALPGVWVWLLTTIARRLTGEVPPVALAILWLGVGVIRGVVGGAVASFAGLDPEWAFRIVFWCVLAFIWTPLLTYAQAQGDEYRRLLAVRKRAMGELELLEARSRETAEERAGRMREAVADALGPALDEVRAGLRTARIDALEVEGIRRRLDRLSVQAREFTSPPVDAPAHRPERASLPAAMSEFQQRRPVFAGALTAVAVAPVLLLEQFRVGGLPAVAEMTVAIAIATLVFVLVAAGTSRLGRPGIRRFAFLRIGTLLGGVLGALAIAFLPWSWLPDDAFLSLAVVPLLFSTAADILSTAVALEATNARLGVLIAEEDELARERLRAVQESEELASARLLELVRGELSGRLASCAMALAFLAAGTFTVRDRERVIGSMVDQLDTASARLRELRP